MPANFDGNGNVEIYLNGALNGRASLLWRTNFMDSIVKSVLRVK